MSRLRFLTLPIATLCVVLGAHRAQAQEIWGYSIIDYNEATQRFTSASTTELDYMVQEYYQARVISNVTDQDGAGLALGSANDTDGDGSVTVVLQGVNATAEEFQVKGTHAGILRYYDYPLGQQRRYWDYFNFLDFIGLNIDYQDSYGFIGNGPAQQTTQSSINLGKTYSYAHTGAVRVTLNLKSTGTMPNFAEFDKEFAIFNCVGTAQLGPLPMGQGRCDTPDVAYTSPIIVIGQVLSVANYNKRFRWTRQIRRRSWYIRWNQAGMKWIVTQRSKRPDGAGFTDDTEPTGESVDATPSATGKIYSYDNSALVPIASSGQSLSVGDYIREEKAFKYQVAYFDGSKWVNIGKMDVGQIIAVKRKAATGSVPADWDGLENSNRTRLLDAIITIAEARAVVGGGASIELAADANN